MSNQSEAKQIEKIKTRAQQHFDAIVSAAGLTSTNSLRIGYHAYRMKADSLFQVLGYETEDAAREAADVGSSTWYAMIRLAESFKEVSEKDFCKMKQANAKALTDLPESKRKESYWLRLAETATMKDFAAKIDEEMNGKAKPSDTKERSSKISLVMPASRKQVIEEKAKEFAVSHGMDAGDIGKAIEVMAIEATDGVTLIGAITTSLQRVKEIKEMMKSGISADEALAKVSYQLDEMVFDFSKALEQAQNRKDAAA